MATVGVILSGCGYLDGAEIIEAVSVLIALQQRGATVRCFAPDTQLAEVDHLSGEATGAKRSVLKESARIARGQVENITDADPMSVDAWILPGGFGVAKNLCSFATEGPACSVDPEVERVLRGAHEGGLPIGLACIAPALGARLFGAEGVKLTIGSDDGTAGALEQCGAVHVVSPVTETVADARAKLVSTPAYMENTDPASVFEGISKMVAEVLAMTGP